MFLLVLDLCYSFPGGKADDGDQDPIHTALRESHEEIGLPEDKIDIWGTLAPVPGRVQMTTITLVRLKRECFFSLLP